MASNGFKSVMLGLVQAYELLGASKECIDKIKKNYYEFTNGENLFEGYEKETIKNG